jgi:hypothetical protein
MVKKSPKEIEKAFGEADSITQMCSDWHACFEFLRDNGVLGPAPTCPVCKDGMELVTGGYGGKRDSMSYSCKQCLVRESIRHGSFLATTSGSL